MWCDVVLCAPCYASSMPEIKRRNIPCQKYYAPKNQFSSFYARLRHIELIHLNVCMIVVSTIYYSAIHIDGLNSVLYECLCLIFTLYSPVRLFLSLTHFPGVSFSRFLWPHNFCSFALLFTHPNAHVLAHTHTAWSLFDRLLKVIRKHVLIQMIVCPHVMCVMLIAAAHFVSPAIFFALQCNWFQTSNEYIL